MLFSFAFDILFFALNFYQFDYCVSLCVPPWVYSAWDSLCFLDWVTISFPTLGKFSANYLFKYFLRSFLSLFSFWDPYNMNIGVVNVPKVSSMLLISSFFPLFCFMAVIFHCSVLQFTLHSFVSFILLLILSSTFLNFSYFIAHLFFILQFF